MLPFRMFNWAPFEIFDPTLVHSEGLLRGATHRPSPVWLTPFFSQPSVLPRPQLLSFDNHLDCLCSIFVLFTSAISLFLAPRAFFEGSTLARSLPKRATHLYCFQSLAHSFLPRRTSMRGQKTIGVYPFAHVPSAPSLVAAAPVYNRVSSTEAFS